MKKTFLPIFLSVLFFFSLSQPLLAQRGTEPNVATSPEPATASSTVIERVEPTPQAPTDLTQKTESAVEPLKRLLDEQDLGSVLPFNPIKYAIRASVAAGVQPNTLVLLLLLPGVAALIAAARHLIGLRGFGIFLPAALSIVFVAMGPLIGIGFFLIIVFVSTATRIFMRRSNLKLQYLPRMALLLHIVVLGILLVLFLAPLVKRPDFANVSIFPILILVLLAEDFSRVQLGKSAKVAVSLAFETLILALGSYAFMTTKAVQEFALLNPEIWIVSIVVFDLLLGRYVGLRLMEFWRFRKLIKA